MDKYLFEIAGRCLAIEAPDMEAVMPWLDGFHVFRTDTGGPLLTFVAGSLKRPSGGAHVYSFDVLERQRGELYRTDTGWEFFVRANESIPEVYFVLDTATGRAYSNMQVGPGMSNIKFVLWMAYGLMLLEKKIIGIHSSAVVWGGSAVLFLGESGTGKSTHTSLWLKHIEGAQLLNDDSPFIDVSGGEAICHGSPWSGKGRCYRRESYPVKAIVRLRQAPYNEMTRLNKLNAIGAVYPSCPPSFAYDDRLSDGVFAVISALVSQVPVYTLECLPDEAAARLSFRTIFG